jgi:2-(1,2-epoxy-1,2-dihydrophenyl)acetyl-CoA isomerase
VYETILFDKSGGVTIISLNRPKVLNAFNMQLHEEIYDALNDAAADDEVRCIVLRGEGKGFSAGADLAEVVESDDNPDGPDLGKYLRETYSRLITRMVSIEKPIVAALHGPVYGAGLGLALACDLRLAAESARFSVAFIKIGLIPDAGVSFFLPRVVGLGRAMQMSMLGEALDAQEAHRVGLVNKVVPDEKLEEEVSTVAGRLAGCRHRRWVGSSRSCTEASRATSPPLSKPRPWARPSAATRRTTGRASPRSPRSATLPLPAGRGAKEVS